MRNWRLLIGVLAGLATASALLFGRAPHHPQRAAAVALETRAATDQGAVGQLLAGFSTGDTGAYVRRLERRVRLQPRDGQTLTLLGLAYQQRARETGDPSSYGLSARALARARGAGGPRALVLQALASLANTQHRFREGLGVARRATRADRYNASAYGALGDALLNLGRYRQAFAAYDRMAVLAPGIAAFARIANARELTGRPEAAVDALELALDADATVPEQVAWTQVQLGNVRFNHGELALAASAYRAALLRLPGYVHAEAGLARVAAARGRLARASRLLEHVVEVLPLPAYVIMLGDVRHAAGDETGARRQYRLVDAIERLFEANGVRTELQTALFDLDHGRNVRAALARARAAYASAPGVYAETRSPGACTAPAAAPRLSRAPPARCGSARRTRS